MKLKAWLTFGFDNFDSCHFNCRAEKSNFTTTLNHDCGVASLSVQNRCFRNGFVSC